MKKLHVNEDKLYVHEKVKSGNNVIKFGEEIKVGEVALTKGTVIRPTEIGVLASLGYSSIRVHRDPIFHY